MKLLSPLKHSLRRILNRIGYDLVRHPVPPGSDQLWPAWVRKLRTTGPIETVFDVGANRGQTIAWFRPLFPGATIYAFEPYPPAFRDLCVNTAGDSRVKAVALALGEHTGTATLFENSADSTNSLLKNAPLASEYTPAHMCIPKGSTEITIERLDTFCARENIERIDVLKIDAQGYEKKILEGAGDMLRPDRIRALFLELLFVDYYEGQAWGGELLEFLRARGYRLFGFAGVSFDETQGWRWSDAMFIGADVTPA